MNLKRNINKFMLLIYLVLIFLFLDSCDKKQLPEKEIKKDTLISYSINRTENKSISNNKIDELEKDYVAAKTGLIVSPDKLEKFLPSKIDGYKSTQASSGRFTDNGIDKTTCTKGYLGNNGGIRKTSH